METEASWRGPLFIVGASRSGTTMLRSILNRSPNISLAGETHYFDDLRPRVIGKKLPEMTEAERNRCLDYFRSQSVRPYGTEGDPEQSPLSRSDLLAAAEELGDNADSVFQAYCQMRTRRNNAIWGEKTPRHVFRIDDILSAFPSAKIICITRDPRGVVASYRDWKYQGGLTTEGKPDYEEAIRRDHERKSASYNIVIASLMWRAAANAALKAANKYGVDRVRVVKYEEVTDDPEPILTSLTSWIGVEFGEAMLDIPVHNSSTIKFSASAGLSKAPQMRWRDALSENEIHVIQSVAGKTMTQLGYAPLDVKSNLSSVARAYASVPGAIIRAAKANRSRHNSLPKYIMRRLKAAIG
jgi:hypothetical protein